MDERRELRRRFGLTKESALGVIQSFALAGNDTLEARDAGQLLRHFTPEDRIGAKFLSILVELALGGHIGWRTPLEEKATGAISGQLWHELERGLNETWDELKLPSLASEPREHNLRLYYVFGRATDEWAQLIPTRATEAPLGWVHIDEVNSPETPVGLRQYGRYFPEVGSSEADIMISYFGEKTGLTFDELAKLLGLDEPCEWLDLEKGDRPRNILGDLLTQWVDGGELDQFGPTSDPRYKLRQGPPLGNAADVYVAVWPWRYWVGPKEIGATEAAERAYCKPPTASGHLKTLASAGFVKKLGENARSNAPYVPNGAHALVHLTRVVARSLQEKAPSDPAAARLTLKELEAKLSQVEIGGGFAKLRAENRITFLEAAVGEGLLLVTGERRRRRYAADAEVKITPKGWLTIQGCPTCARPLHEGDSVIARPTRATTQFERDGWTTIRHADCEAVKKRSWSEPPEPLPHHELRVRTESMACASCRGPLWNVTVADQLEGHGQSGGRVGVALATLERLRTILKDAPPPPVPAVDPRAILRELETSGLSVEHRSALLARLLSWASSVDLAPKPNQHAWLDTLAAFEQRYHRTDTGLVRSFKFWEDLEDAQEQLGQLVWRATRGKESQPARAVLGKTLLHHAACPDAEPREDA